MFKVNKAIFLLLLILPALCFGEELKVNNQPVEHGQTLDLFYDDLEAGKINFSISADKLKKAEISMDRGGTWKELQAEKGRFSYAYRPLSDENISPEFILTSEDGTLQTLRPNLTIRYHKKKPDEAVKQVFEKLKTYYENENIFNFMNLFSMSFPDRVKFQEAIQNDFYNYKNLRLFYRIEQRIFDDDYEGSVSTVFWERKGENRTGTAFSDSAIITTRLDKDGSDWLISGFRNNTIFGSSLLGTTATSASQPDFSIASSDITITYTGVYKVRVTANVHNIGNASANNVKVKFYKKGPLDADYVDIANDQTIATISANSSATASIIYDATLVLGGNHTFKVVVDPNHTITESDETNNTAISAVHNIIP